MFKRDRSACQQRAQQIGLTRLGCGVPYGGLPQRSFSLRVWPLYLYTVAKPKSAILRSPASHHAKSRASAGQPRVLPCCGRASPPLTPPVDEHILGFDVAVADSERGHIFLKTTECRQRRDPQSSERRKESAYQTCDELVQIEMCDVLRNSDVRCCASTSPDQCLC